MPPSHTHRIALQCAQIARRSAARDLALLLSASPGGSAQRPPQQPPFTRP